MLNGEQEGYISPDYMLNTVGSGKYKNGLYFGNNIKISKLINVVLL